MLREISCSYNVQPSLSKALAFPLPTALPVSSTVRALGVPGSGELPSVATTCPVSPGPDPGPPSRRAPSARSRRSPSSGASPGQERANLMGRATESSLSWEVVLRATFLRVLWTAWSGF